ncbi:MAG TPA: hypothetical protein PKV65_19395, partial [Acidovorax defluvii]|nr:hypothetical protein [Acidovorax defluvii]
PWVVKNPYSKTYWILRREKKNTSPIRSEQMGLCAFKNSTFSQIHDLPCRALLLEFTTSNKQTLNIQMTNKQNNITIKERFCDGYGLDTG